MILFDTGGGPNLWGCSDARPQAPVNFLQTLFSWGGHFSLKISLFLSLENNIRNLKRKEKLWQKA